MAQLPERFRFDLADALPRDRKALTDFLQRMLAAVADTEPHFDDLFLAWRQRLEHRLGLLFQIEVDDGLGWRHDLTIFDEIAQMRIFFLADRGLERDGLLCDLEHLPDLRHRDVHSLRDLFRGWLAPELLDEGAGGSNQLVDRL